MRPANEEFATVEGVRLCYETFGDDSRPALLLVMGLGTQMIGWHADFCSQLADRGFFVVRYDNRDVGRSTHLSNRPAPTTSEIVTRRHRNPAYTLGDMAADGIGLLDQLGIGAAHVVGASMGGMLAQLMAAWWPERVRSLVSIMSNTGSLRSGQPALRVYPSFLAKPAKSREEHIERFVKVFGIIGSSGFDRDDGDLRLLAGTSYDRGADPEGSARQLAAIQSGGSRVRDLRRIKAPTLVIHGTVDRLVRPSGGRATAKAIPNARLQLIEGMGHDLPRGAWPQIIDGIVENAAAAAPPARALAGRHG
jgi:pimeloyl-ACP methyl ester carboxylesterase